MKAKVLRSSNNVLFIHIKEKQKTRIEVLTPNKIYKNEISTRSVL